MTVYRGMDQATLDREYDARASVADFEFQMRRYREESDRSYASCRVLRDMAYGDHPDERIDVFPAGANAPILVYIHGGYWRLLGRSDSAFMAKSFVEHGVTVAAVEYSLAPSATLDQIVDQVRRALAWLYRHAERFSGDRDRIFVAGSSAGGHLGAMAAMTDWPRLFDLPADLVKGATLFSGLFDLEPVRLSRPNEWLKLDADAAKGNSPIHMEPKSRVAMGIYWGESETSEFKRQSIDFASAMVRRRNPIHMAEIAGRNHFDVVMELADASSWLFQQELAKIVR